MIDYKRLLSRVGNGVRFIENGYYDREKEQSWINIVLCVDGVELFSIHGRVDEVFDINMIYEKLFDDILIYGIMTKYKNKKTK